MGTKPSFEKAPDGADNRHSLFPPRLNSKEKLPLTKGLDALGRAAMLMRVPKEKELAEKPQPLRQRLLALAPLNITPQTVEEMRALRDSVKIGIRVAYRYRLPRFKKVRDIKKARGIQKKVRLFKNGCEG